METASYFSCHIMLVKLKGLLSCFMSTTLNCHIPTSHSTVCYWVVNVIYNKVKMPKFFLFDNKFSIWDSLFFSQFSSHLHHPNTGSSDIRLYFGSEGGVVLFCSLIEKAGSITSIQALFCLKTCRAQAMGFWIMITIILWNASLVSVTTDLHKASQSREETWTSQIFLCFIYIFFVFLVQTQRGNGN